MTFGVFLVVASFYPLEHLSLIWFWVWPSIVHGGIMAVQSLAYLQHRGHFFGDVIVLLISAWVIAVLTPKRKLQKLQTVKKANSLK